LQPDEKHIVSQIAGLSVEVRPAIVDAGLAVFYLSPIEDNPWFGFHRLLRIPKQQL
jgi:hypothetical protein